MRPKQSERLARLLNEILPRNEFYQQKFALARLKREDIRQPADLWRLPLTTKAELLDDQQKFPPYGRRLTYAVERYTRLHQTSGTSGVPLRCLDTPESWQRLLGCWQSIFDVVGVTPGDRLLFPFSFGPFLGFWTAFEAGVQHGCLCLPAGGLSSGARLRMLLDNQATVVLTTPTYALHLAELARQQDFVLGPEGGCKVRMLILAGEPGASIPATRARLEAQWHARVFDHSGMTEVGPMSIECPENPGGVHILEDEYLVEVVDPKSAAALAVGELGEMVVTNLHRLGSPLIRYRTGDLVRIDAEPCPCGRTLMRLKGGILGRTDDMMLLRGNNFYPSALEGVIRRFVEVVEYRVKVDARSPLAELRVEVETATQDAGSRLAQRLVEAIRDELLFRAEVVVAPPGSLPRFEMKAQRVTVEGR